MIRNVPPWNEGGPGLTVGWDPQRSEFIIRAPGGHIIGATACLEEVGQAIKFESEWGFGAMELQLQGCRYCQTHHGLAGRRTTSTPSTRKSRRGGSSGSTTIVLTLEDLGL